MLQGGDLIQDYCAAFHSRDCDDICPFIFHGMGTVSLSLNSHQGSVEDPSKTPLTVGISRMIDNQTPWEMVMTGTLLAIIPAIVIYLCAQKYLVQGLTAGSVK